MFREDGRTKNETGEKKVNAKEMCASLNVIYNIPGRLMIHHFTYLSGWCNMHVVDGGLPYTTCTCLWLAGPVDGGLHIKVVVVLYGEGTSAICTCR